MQDLQSASINGLNIHWLDKGQGEPVVFIPGAIGDYRTWTCQVDAFAKYFRVIVMNRRFQFPEKYEQGGSSSVADNCDDLLRLLKYLHLSKVTLVGHSYGGYIAIAFAEKYPDMIDKLVLEEPAVFTLITSNPNNPITMIPLALKDFGAALSFMRTGIKGIKPTQNYIAQGEFEKAKLSVINGIMGHKVPLDELNPIMRQGLEDNIASFEGDSRKAFIYPLPKEKLRAMKTKTLLLEGDKSPKWFQHICKELKQILPDAQLVKLISSTHWLHLDKADDFNKTVINFLKKEGNSISNANTSCLS